MDVKEPLQRDRELFNRQVKARGKVGGEVYYRELSINISFGPPDYFSVFQGEIDVIRRKADSFREMTNHSDSGVAILALSSLTVRSGLVTESLTSLSIA